jgi:hypothetical protein
MWDLCRLIWWVLVDLFRSRRALEAEILVLRQQINVLRRTASKRLLIGRIDRLILVGLYRLSNTDFSRLPAPSPTGHR